MKTAEDGWLDRGLTMTNAEKYGVQAHGHYVWERQCPKCNVTVCGREPSDFRECRVVSGADYREWLDRRADDGNSA